jgi:hypothetical protein
MVHRWHDVDPVATSHRRLAIFRRIRRWQTSVQRLTQRQAALLIALPLISNAVIAYNLFGPLTVAFDANLGTVILFQPDVGWIAVISGIFAIA